MTRQQRNVAQLIILLIFAIVVVLFAENYKNHKGEEDVFNFDFLTLEQEEAKNNARQAGNAAQPTAALPKASLKERQNKFLKQKKLVTFKPEKSQSGFTLYPLSGPDEVYLLNHRGEVVHTWENVDADRARLLNNGNLLVLHGSKDRMKVSPWRELRKQVAEYNWEGDKVWSYTSPNVLHHDAHRLDNGNTLVLAKVRVPKSFSEQIKDPLRSSLTINADVIQEITPEKEIAWQWNSWEHLDLEDCGVRPCLKPAGQKQSISDLEDWTHINTISVLPENKWYDDGDQRFKPGNILIMPRNFWTMMILDRESGKIVWEYRSDYKGGMIGGHEPQMIGPDLPGAGNIIVLDNGSEERAGGSSFILEINPVSEKIVWVYDNGSKFFTRARGSVQRLANGNTLISADRQSRVFEVTKDHEVVWDLLNNYLVIRAHRYSDGQWLAKLNS